MVLDFIIVQVKYTITELNNTKIRKIYKKKNYEENILLATIIVENIFFTQLKCISLSSNYKMMEMKIEEILNHKTLSLYKDNILGDLNGVYYVSLFDMATILDILRPNAYKLIKQNHIMKEHTASIREIGGVMFIPVGLVAEVLEEREKRKQVIAFRKASSRVSSGVSPAQYVKDILNHLSDEEKQKALEEILSLANAQTSPEKKGRRKKNNSNL